MDVLVPTKKEDDSLFAANDVLFLNVKEGLSALDSVPVACLSIVAKCECP